MTRQLYLLDTCICAYLLRGKYDVAQRIDSVGFRNCYISEITVAELKFGRIYGQLKGGPKFREQGLERFLDAINILPVSSSFDLYAEEKARLQLAGTPGGDFDLLIGCTAVTHKMVMVTENVKDFRSIQGIEIENWVTR